MKHYFTIAIHLIAAAASLAAEVYFAPGPEPEAAMVREIGGEHTAVLCQYYGFTSPAVAQALIEAKRRGCDVQVLLDRSNLTQAASQAAAIAAAGVRVSIDARHPIAHNKVTILVGSGEVLEGSYNPTEQAKHNAENLVVLHDAKALAAYRANWQAHAQHSDPYKPPPAAKRK